VSFSVISLMAMVPVRECRMPTLTGSADTAAEMKPRLAIMPDARPRRRWRMLDMMFFLFPFAPNKQICSQQEKPGLHKDG
jgi:hypothetical protein